MTPLVYPNDDQMSLCSEKRDCYPDDLNVGDARINGGDILKDTDESSLVGDDLSPRRQRN